MISIVTSARRFLYGVAAFLFLFTLLQANLTAYAITAGVREASDVLGQVDLQTNTSGLSATEFNSPTSVVVDEVNHRLFVADGINSRVLVYNLTTSNKLVDKTADFVLGQPDFTSNNRVTTASGMSLADAGLVFDEENNRLFVSDEGNVRILVFDTTTITNGEPAVYVLGQDDFVSNDSGLTANRFDYNESTPAYDPERQWLFVPEYNNDRVLIFDVSSITNGEDAIHVLGAPDFTTDNGGTSSTALGLEYVGSAYDHTTNRFYLADENNNRVLVYDMDAVTDGEPAIHVLGQEDFTSSGDNSDADGMSLPTALAIDRDNQMLFVVDKSNYRILMFDVSSITNGEDAVGVLGQPDLVSNDLPTGASADTIRTSDATGMYYAESTNTLYIAEQANHRISIWEDPYDGDGVDKYDEDSAPNEGDGNGDGELDSYQSNVSSLPNPEANDDSGAYITIQTSGCTGLMDVAVTNESSLGNDATYDYPAGLMQFSVECTNPGDSANVTIYLDKQYSTTGMKLRKSLSGSYRDISGAIFGTATLGATTVTTISYTVVDGGELDADGSENGTIVDPVGVAVLPSTTSLVGAPATGFGKNDGMLAQLSLVSGITLAGYMIYDHKRKKRDCNR